VDGALGEYAVTDDTKLAMAAVLLGVIGCGGARSVAPDAGPPDAGRDGAPGDALDGAGDARGAEKTDAACSMAGWDAGPAAVAPRDQGRLILAQIGTIGGFTTSGLFSASFSRAGQLVAPPPLLVGLGHMAFGPGVCDLGTFGPCVVTTTECAIPTPPCAAPQAGKIAFGPPDELSDPISPNPDGTYVPEDIEQGGGGPIFVPGDSQAVAAAGGDLRPFSLQTTAPGCIALLQPAMTPIAADAAVYSSRYTIARSQDLALAWTGGETDATVGVDLFSTFKDGRVVDVSCSFPAADGQGTIPQQALSALEAGPVGSLHIYQERSVSTQVGTFDVELAVRNLGDGDSAPDAGTCPVNNASVVTFQ
jgi:hypothetical protein